MTVLFADVTESTELGESIDVEDLRALLATYYDLAKRVIAAHGASVEKFIGDAVMAVFGTPVAHGDDPDRALSAALELRDLVRREPSLSGRLRIRIGVNTGVVVASREPSAGDFLVTGDPVTVAARLQQTARPWGIACGVRTLRAAGATFKFGPIYSVEVKGKQTPVRAAQLLGRQAAPLRSRTRLIGRDSDLAQLEIVAKRALVERRPMVASVVAPAGTGKTRLLEEFLSRLPAMAPDAVVATAQCLPYGQRLTYWPLRAILFRLARISEDASPQQIRDGIRTWLSSLDLAETPRVAEVLATTIGVGEAEVADGTTIHTAWRSALEAAARGAPLVIVFEDLHWSSDSLLDLVEYVMQPRGDLPLMFVALARPELLDRRPGWGGGRRNYLALSLEPLSNAAVGELVRELIEADAPQFAERVASRADGNPFFAGELVRSVVEQVPSLADVAAVDRTLATLPDTVQATLLARIDLLEPDERRVLQLAAILGRSFRASGIAAIEPVLAHDSEPIIEQLAAKDLVRPAGDDRYTFRHILIREVAYQTMPRAERARLHAAAARWYETRAAGREVELAEIVAYHFREAVSLARSGTAPVPADLTVDAVRWLMRAAEVALASAANVEAVRHLRGAVELAAPAQLPELYERIGDAFASVEAADAYQRALELSRDVGGSADQQLRAIAGMLHVHLRTGGMGGQPPTDAEITRLMTEGTELVQRATDEVATARFLVAQSFYPFWLLRNSGHLPGPADLASAEDRAHRALEVATRTKDVRLQSAALDASGSILSLRGDHRGARELARQRIAMGEALELRERLDAYTVATWYSIYLGDLDEAIRTSAAGLAVVQPGQAPGWTLHLVSWRTLALTLVGRWDEAVEAAERARTLWIESGRTAAGYALHGFFAGLVVAHARRNDTQRERFREPLEEIGTAIGHQGRKHPLEFLSHDPQEPDHYLRYFDQRQPETIELAIAFASDRDKPPPERLLERLRAGERYVSTPLVEAEIARALGLLRRDPAKLAEAIAVFERCGAAPSAARARCERAVLTGDQDELRAGVAILDRLGDARQLARFRVSAV
ncbi:MAG: hypothetical protein AUH33_01300 [Chloroflexi bacterium 13_1_40CM_68_21]|nr:MAG: hypothetical protein AUH33_01300 [Chloroflexi bacterium 13_1_40CM_68_21]